jgi:hypothetical protein
MVEPETVVVAEQSFPLLFEASSRVAEITNVSPPFAVEGISKTNVQVALVIGVVP